MHDVLETAVVEEAGPRLDAWAAAAFVNLPSRSAARKVAKRGELLLNGEVVETSRFVKPGDVVTLTFPKRPPPPCTLRPLLAHRDEHCAVVVKPAGLLVNGNRHRTLEHSLLNVLPPPDRPDALPMPRPVHRLDYETMGLVAVARTGPAIVALGHAFERREVAKRYAAIVVGHLEGEGTIDTPLDGRAAVSKWRALRPFRSLKPGWCTEVELVPVTGRMHQLRRHMLELGHPILGDMKYVDDPRLVYRHKGLFLAATSLDFPHPVEAGRVHAEVAPPAKFRSFRVREERRWVRWHAARPEMP